MAVDFFLKVDGADGESTQSGHTNEIKIHSFSWGCSQQTSVSGSGGSAAAAPASSSKKVTFTDRDRDVVRKHARASTERRTTGSSGATRVEIRRGERLPDTVEVEEFPETVYRDAPSLREYRYIHRENRTYLVEPTERRVIEEID